MTDKWGSGFVITEMVDADHTGDKVTQCSGTGLIIYVNSVLVYWMPKKRTRCESSYFGS